MQTGKRILWMACLLASGFLYGQTKPAVEVSVEKNRVMLGEVFRFRLQLQFPAGTTGRLPQIDSIPHFEFSKPPEIDSSDEKGARNIKAVYYLSSFDSGHWVIPSYVIAEGLQTDTIGVDVVFADFNPEQSYHDIKDIIEVKPKKSTPWWWLAAGAVLLTGLLLFYFLRRKKPVQTGTTLQVEDPYATAMRSLEALQKANHDPVVFHSGLTAIFRLYLYRKTGILSLQQTTDDLVIQLKEEGLPAELYSRLSQSLRLSDFVKFAKFMPAAADNESCYDNISQAIRLIEQKRKTAEATQPI